MLHIEMGLFLCKVVVEKSFSFVYELFGLKTKNYKRKEEEIIMEWIYQRQQERKRKKMYKYIHIK